MTGTDVQTVSSLLSDLSGFLRNPVIKIMHSDEVAALQFQLQELQKQYDKLAAENDQLFCKYRNELNFSMHLQDICRANGIKWR